MSYDCCFNNTEIQYPLLFYFWRKKFKSLSTRKKSFNFTERRERMNKKGERKE